MHSLLSQSESNAFQSFLSSMDYPDDAIPADEWAAFSASSASLELSSYPEDRQALTKATKDLMSLNTDGKWNDSNGTSSESMMKHSHFDDPETHELGANLYSSRHDSFPFLHTKSQPIRFPVHPVSPLKTGLPDLPQCSPNSPYGFFQQQQLHQVYMPRQHARGEASAGTRPKRSDALPLTSAFASSDSPHKRRRLSASECPPTAVPATTSASHSSSSRPRQQEQQSKPNLLSDSQKKANHIQSEQKRRANIRRGYTALCETVPALREAIKEEEEADGVAPVNTAAVNGVEVGVEVRNSAGKKRRCKKGAAVNGKDLDDRDRDKIDGRAGPRSENIVLSKTIEYIQHLLMERSSLLTRLQRARAVLPTNHPALTTLNPDPAWEREWKGGEGRMNLGDGDGDEEGLGGSGDEEEDG